jgi:hypothetical protein
MFHAFDKGFAKHTSANKSSRINRLISTLNDTVVELKRIDSLSLEEFGEISSRFKAFQSTWSSNAFLSGLLQENYKMEIDFQQTDDCFRTCEKMVLYCHRALSDYRKAALRRKERKKQKSRDSSQGIGSTAQTVTATSALGKIWTFNPESHLALMEMKVFATKSIKTECSAGGHGRITERREISALIRQAISVSESCAETTSAVEAIRSCWLEHRILSQCLEVGLKFGPVRTTSLVILSSRNESLHNLNPEFSGPN